MGILEITFWKWKNRGLKEDIDMMFGIYYIKDLLDNCESCNRPFKNHFDKKMDHCHTTGKFRQIICSQCNANRKEEQFVTNTGEKFISKYSIKRNGFCWDYYRITYTTYEGRRIRPNFSVLKYSLEDVVKIRNELLKIEGITF